MLSRKSPLPTPSEDSNCVVGWHRSDHCQPPGVGAHRPLPTASSIGSESPRRIRHIRHWLEQHFTHGKKKCSKISVCMIYRLWYGQRVPCESQLRVVGCRQFSDTEGEDLVPFPLVANVLVRLARCHMMQRLKQYKGIHWVPSIRERFLLTREKNLGLRDSCLQLPHRKMFQAQVADWMIPRRQIIW